MQENQITRKIINKYELMGKYVLVKAYLKPAKKFSARSHEPVVLEKPRVGMVVGYRTVYDGKIHPGSQRGDYDGDYNPPWFEVEGRIQVLLVCFWPRYKPVLVKPDDIMIPMAVLEKVTDNLHSTICQIPDSVKDYLREEMKNVPRDNKGRWMK